LVQIAAVEIYYFVKGFYLTKSLLEFVKVRFEYFYLHVVNIVFDELEHSMSKSKSLNQRRLHITFFSALVLLPHVFKVFTNILTLK